MKPERWRQVDQLFQAALECAPEERAAFINAACGDDDSLRREVEALLAADGQAKSFIEAPAYAVAAPLLVGGDTPSLLGKSISHYQIISLLGKGGMGEVYRARDTKLDRTVALKILPGEMPADGERMRRFSREAKAASALNHPNVAHIYEIGEAEGVSFIAMEYVEGQTLAARINGAPLAVNEIVEIGSQIADALDEAHSKGITHRDIKPANVMLNERGQVKVLDFGLAKIARPAQPITSDISTMAKTAPGVVMGTVPYMSPEQALGREVDHRSDLFSLGVALYEMATGRLPFSGVNASETLDRILHSQPEAMARFNYDVPAELERIVRKCLEKERERRCQSARELLVDLKNLKRDSGSRAVIAEQEMQADLKRLQRDLSSVPAAAIQPVASAPTNAVRPPARWRKWAVIAVVPVVVLAGMTFGLYKFVKQAPSKGADVELRVVPFTSFPHNELDPSFSPDGNQIAFAWDGEQGDNYDIYVKQIGTDGQVRLTTNSAVERNPVWSPDGRITTAKLPVTQLIASTRGDDSPQFSPDGQKIVFASNRSGTNEIWVCSSDGRNARQITAFRSPQQVGSPRWSPDGRQIVFDARVAGNADIYVSSAEGGKPRQLTTEVSADIVPSFSHDGNWIYFCSNRSGSQQIWKLPAAGGQARQVTQQGGFDNVESPDGQYLYYAKGRGVPGIWRIPVAGGEEKLVLDHHRAGAWRYWAVAPQGIYFLTAETAEHPLMEFFNFATNKIMPIITLEKKIANQGSSLAVSPDGRWLIWSQLDQEGSDIMLMENFR